ncbi:hypothetical protein HYN49_04905 [Flavobacterium pallidum]|uniref:Uncharacterized protein n=2 Tax=Flavobacterium pallidum TaxID=2172098 RepID=A0A2S1SFY6_9FLAO|nr:hypothetical protein HYN49_04905 [Flavobacterium pallidum]
MVNLITGQYSYVLPVMNVPSPEGGYPISLAYHAGIAIDQESSWTGLGWNLNPGAIDRGVNGYPDDYNASHLNEYFWDRTHTVSTYSASIGYTCGFASVGLGFNWGSNQALGGYVSVGVGFDVGGGNSIGVSVTAGSNGASIGVGAQFAGGMSVGVSASTNGDVGVNAGFNSNGAGFSIGYNTSGSMSFEANAAEGTGISMSTSKSGTQVTATVAGTGISSSFNNTVSMGDYCTSSSSWSIPIVVPTPIGVFSLSFGKQEFKYWLGDNDENFVTGPLYFQNGVKDITKSTWVPPRTITAGQGQQEHIPGHWVVSIVGQAFMDINEIPISNNSFSSTSDPAANNITQPNYDNYNVQAQGLSGSMTSTIFENGVLFGLTGKENKAGYKLNYNINSASTNIPDYAKFDGRPNFYMENEISTYINVQSAAFNTTTTNADILNYYNSGSVELAAKNRRKTSNFIEYYTNDQINNNYAALKQQGYLQPTASGFDRSGAPKEGIGAFKITTVDGKTYHYSLPVYNEEIITRTFGVIEDSPAETQSYFEKRQLEPYATHWLLTSVTGPDYVDNGDGVAGEGDLGYWTSFEYGKWTDAFIWKAPYKKEYITDDESPEVKTWIRGRKEIYYLDKVKTRTHTALFVKSTRADAMSEAFTYNAASHVDDLQNNSVLPRFTVPAQAQLKLNKIILLKNEDCTLDKAAGPDANQSVEIKYESNNHSDKTETATYNCYDNVIDVNDGYMALMPKAIKVVNMGYQFSLVGEAALLLKQVTFMGKGGNYALPPYKFDYINDIYNNYHNYEKDDGWGYLSTSPKEYSLKRITTPEGGTIGINYENNTFRSVTPNKLEFSNMNPVRFKCTMPTYASATDFSNKSVIIDIGSANVFPNLLGQTVNISLLRDYVCFNNLFYYFRYESTGHIDLSYGNGKYRVQFDDDIYWGADHHGYTQSGQHGCNMNNVNAAIAYAGNDYYYHQIKVKLDLPSTSVFAAGGVRVASLKVSDGTNNYITDYKYGENEDGIGYTSYIPFAQNLAKELPYSSELPAPRIMYEYVSIKNHKEGEQPEGKVQYKFNIIKTKAPNQIKYDDIYEIAKTVSGHTNTTANKGVSVAAFTVKDNLASIGQLLEVKTFNSQGHMLNKISNSYYKTTDAIPNNMGITQQSYQTYKTVDYVSATLQDKWIVNSSTRIKYPSILKSSTEQKDSYTYTTEFKDYDLISGVSKEQLSTSSDGKSLRTRILPAYSKYQQMGSKVDNIDNTNMLSQSAAQYSYIFDNGTWKETGVGITTWSNIWTYKDIGGDSSNPANEKPIWRKDKSYVWDGVLDSNGMFANYDSATDDNFDWTVGVGQPSNSKWKLTSQITLYDHFSQSLELKDMNGNKAATKMGDNDSKVVAVGNAGYHEMFYSGAEYIKYNFYLDPEVRIQDGASRVPGLAHTGTYAVTTSSGQKFGVVMRNEPNNNHKPGKYKVSVWVHKDQVSSAKLVVSENNTNSFTFPLSQQVKAGDWVLLTKIIDVPASETWIYFTSDTGAVVYYDDLMIRPIASTISGYVYNQWDELSYIINNNGLATRFEYDNAGRLFRTYVEVADDATNGLTGGFKLKSENRINYKGN